MSRAANQSVATSPDRPQERDRSASDERQVLLRMEGVSRQFKEVLAVDSVDLELYEGEVFALLGPSGSGKTTCLRMVAGLEPPDAGRIVMRDKVLADAGLGKSLPPERRNIGMVFQSYAIWPHMTVAQNVNFPLRMRRVPRRDRAGMVREILEVTGMSAQIDRPATMLSGGQQQRIALARALVYHPDLLLLDEPLSNLDTRLRRHMRRELRRLNRELKVSMLFVTHDHDEAFSLADRIAVMSNGVVEQVGTPADLYERPRTTFVRDFLGRGVVVHGVLAELRDGSAVVKVDSPSLQQSVLSVAHCAQELAAGTQVTVYCRPEDLTVAPHLSGGTIGANQVVCDISSTAYLGDRVEYILDIAGSPTVVMAPRAGAMAAGDTVILTIDPESATVWPR